MSMPANPSTRGWTGLTGIHLAAVLWSKLGAELVASTHLLKVPSKEPDQPGYRQQTPAWSWYLNRSLGPSRSN